MIRTQPLTTTFFQSTKTGWKNDPTFCDLVHVQSNIELFGTVKPWHGKPCELVLPLRLEFRPSFRPSNARIFFFKTPVFLQTLPEAQRTQKLTP